MQREATVGRRDATLVMSKRQRIAMEGIGQHLGTAFGEIYGHLDRSGIAPEGPPFVIYHSMPEGGTIDLEVCAPVSRAGDPPEGWGSQELPAGLFATLVHVGPYDTVAAAYDELASWIGDHGLAVAGPPREVYLDGPETPPERIRTIVEFPVEEVAAPVPAG